MKLYRTPLFVKWLYFNRKWSFPFDNSYHLTFDDGPHPSTTPWLLQWLQEHNLKATFFCVGANVEKYPDLFAQIIAEGHQVGNHTMNHEKGWKVSTRSYLESVDAAGKLIPSKQFRPPYGKMKYSQARALRKQGYDLIMWSWLTYDFDETTPIEKMKEIVAQLKAGDIVVLHDNPKCFERTKAMMNYL